MEDRPENLGFSPKIELAKVDNAFVIKPKTSAFPIEHGLHLAVKEEEEKEWRNQELTVLLKDLFYSLPVAKTVAEGRFTADLWANIHLSAREGFNQGVNVFGRNPQSEHAWGKPVFYNRTEQILSEDQVHKLKREFERYLPIWREVKPEIRLFEDGLETFPPESEEFKAEFEKFKTINETVVWASEKFTLVTVDNPHLNGLHLVLHPRQEYWDRTGGYKRPWQLESKDLTHITGFLEANAILIGLERILLEEQRLPFYNPEIHFSGNWSKSLRPKEEGGALDLSYLKDSNLEKVRKEEKREHRVGGPDEWKTFVHGHLYATSSSNEYVTLPSRPKNEVPEEWENISPLNKEIQQEIMAIVQDRLDRWVSSNVPSRI